MIKRSLQDTVAASLRKFPVVGLIGADNIVGFNPALLFAIWYVIMAKEVRHESND